MKFTQRIAFSSGWRRRSLAALSGAFGALSLAPVNLLPALIGACAISVWLLDGLFVRDAKAKGGRIDRQALTAAFADGWWLGFGYFVAGLWWLGAAFLVEAQDFAWALPLGVAGLPAVLACFTALGFVCARLFWSSGASRILVFALSLTAAEWLRATVLTGFPWNAFGMALGGHLVLAQAASLVGLHGLTLLALLICASPATLTDRTSRRVRWAAPLGGIILLAGLAGMGYERLLANPTRFDPAVKIRVVQPNTPQDEKFRPERRDQILAHYLQLSSQPSPRFSNGLDDVTHLIWPESAFPFFLARDPAALETISAALKSTILITGAARVEATQSGEFPGEIRKVSYFNAIQIVGADGRILDSYDKAHLVPFGEYLPFAGMLESFGLRQFVHIPGGFEPGTDHKLIDAPGLPRIFPLICYEAIFPGVLDPVLRTEAGLIVNVSNDGWFGATAGPYQHLAQARLRSIEEGLPLMRGANTGMSAVFDAYGRLIGRLPLNAEGVLDIELPLPAAPPLFALHPVLAPLAFFFLVAGLLFGLRRRRF